MYTYFMLLHLLGLLSALYLWLTIADDCLLSYSIMHCVWGLHYDSCILRVKWVSKVQSVLASCPFGSETYIWHVPDPHEHPLTLPAMTCIFMTHRARLPSARRSSLLALHGAGCAVLRCEPIRAYLPLNGVKPMPLKDTTRSAFA